MTFTNYPVLRKLFHQKKVFIVHPVTESIFANLWSFNLLLFSNVY